jgi:hypothetical protein
LSPALLQIVLVVVAGWIAAAVLSTPTRSMALGLGAILAGAFLMLFLARPEWAILFVLLGRASSDVTAYLIPGIGGRGELGNLVNIGLVLILTVAGGLYILARSLPAISLPGGRVLALLLVTGLVGVLRAGRLLYSMNEWIPILASFVTYALVANLVSTPKQGQRLVDIILASFIVPALFGFYQLLLGQGVSRTQFAIPGVVGTFVHPNGFGFYLVLISALLLGQLFFHTGRRKAMALAGLASALVLVVATYARVAWAGMLVVVLVVAVLRARVLLFLLPLVVFGSLLLIPSVGQRLADPMATGGSLEDRVMTLWPATLNAWLSATDAPGSIFVTAVNRLAGLGPGIGPALARFGLGAIPHNDYLRVLVEYGLFGLALQFALSGLLVVMALRTWMRLKDARNPEAAAPVLSFLALSVAFPVMSITDNLFAHTANQLYFWTLAGLTAAASDWHLAASPVDSKATAVALRASGWHQRGRPEVRQPMRRT